MNTPMNCLCCNKPIQIDEFVYDATVWRTHGGFGSDVYDEDEPLEAVICDGCLKANHERVVQVIEHREVRYERLPWRPVT